MSAPVAASVYIDGQHVADTAPEFYGGETTVLSGAQVVWGRSTVVDQPEPSSCTLTLARAAAAAPGFLSLLKIGRRLDLTTTATVYPDPSASTFLDPGFDNPTAPSIPTNATARTVAQVAPPTVRTNLAIDPSWENTGVSAWTASAGASARVTDWAMSGVRSARFTALAVNALSTAGDLRMTPGGQQVFPPNILPGHTYTVSAYINTPAAHTNFSTATASRQRRICLYYSTNGSTFVEDKGPQGTNTVGVQRISHTFTVPADATGCIIAVGCAGSNTDLGFITYIDAVLVEEGTTLGTYFDGDTPDTPSTDYAWSGTVGGSTSTATTTPTTVRTNLFGNPQAVTGGGAGNPPTGFGPAHAAWSGSQIPGTGFGTTFAARYTRVSTVAARYGFFVGTRMLTGTRYAVRFKVRASASTTVTLWYRPNVNSSASQVQIGDADRALAPGAVVEFVETFTTSTGAITTGAGVALIEGTGAVGATLDISAVIVEAADTSPSFFDGSTPDTSTTDYAWTADADASPSTATTFVSAGQWLQVVPRDATRPASVILAPAPFVPVGTDPDAWDAIPATSMGQTWGYGARIRAAKGATVSLRPVLFGGPWASGYVVINEPLTLVGDDEWHTLAGEFLPNAAGAWVGIEVSAFPAGLPWDAMPPALAWDGVDPARTWDSYGDVLVDDVLVTAPVGGVARTVLVFSGRITDQEARFDTGVDSVGGGAVLVDITAQDFTADLANVRIGDAPWPVQRLDTRVARILALAAVPGVSANIDASVADTLVTYRDVDSQGATGLIVELAASVDAVAWSATHQTTGPYWWLEDIANRPALARLGLDGGLITIVVSTDVPGSTELSACLVLLDPVRFAQDVSDTSTRVDVTWNEQGVDDEGKVTTTERHEVLVDADLETATGQRGLSLSTQLQAQPDAHEVAARILARVTDTGWRLTGVTWRTNLRPLDAADVDRALDLLDGTTRIGRPFVVTDLPEWSPSGGSVATYVEGGTYTVGDDGWWELDLTASSTRGPGRSSTWDELDPAWTWDQWAPEVTWSSLSGVAGPGTPTRTTQPPIEVHS